MRRRNKGIFAVDIQKKQSAFGGARWEKLRFYCAENRANKSFFAVGKRVTFGARWQDKMRFLRQEKQRKQSVFLR